ncbi:MAG: efflux RND transporter periplasmic adaptor subunit [Chitinophagales bacterium]|jgi:RND family efflux transporter MFP subunit|nr:efflux RND transporter periplasmic adaptor subunit [Chitinophagales bacterium]
MKTIFYFIFFLLLTSCNSPSEDSHAEVTEGDSGFINLTEKQVKSVEMSFCSLTSMPIASIIKLNGMLEVPNQHKAQITALTNGVLHDLKIIPGDFVRKGQIIATMKNTSILPLQQDYLSTSNKLYYAQLELERQETLFRGNAGAAKNLERAKMEQQSLLAQKNTLSAQLNMLGIAPNKISAHNLTSLIAITSPIEGYVSLVHAKLGSYVTESQPIAEIINNKELHMDLYAYEKDLPYLKVGNLVDFHIVNNDILHYKARIYNMGKSFREESKSVSVHCDIMGDKENLIDGMHVNAKIQINETLQEVLPNEAIVEIETKPHVFALISQKKRNNQTIYTFKPIEIIKGDAHNGFTAVIFRDSLDKKHKFVQKGSYALNLSEGDE